MPHFSEMNFLFLNTPNKLTEATKSIKNTVGTEAKSIYDDEKEGEDNGKYYVYKGPWGNSKKLKGYDEKTKTQKEKISGTKPGIDNIKAYTQTSIYDSITGNPYVDLIKKFNGENTSKSLIIKASDLAYLRYLGVYPINRMVVLRRFHVGQSVPEKIDELQSEPISVVVGWLKEDDNFGDISFNEDWTKTTSRLDEIFGTLIKENFNKGENIKSIMPVPGFARGLLFRLLKAGGMTTDDTGDAPWDWNKIPIGDPDVLREGPFRDPNSQNIKSKFEFTFDTTYEQKFIGDVDPGAAMIDIIDNALKMGTSDMKYWLNGDSGIIKDSMTESTDSVFFWWELVKNVITKFGKLILNMISETIDKMEDIKDKIKETAENLKDDFAKTGKKLLEKTLDMILVSTISKYRWELKGSMEMMTGSVSSTPWYLTIGNPYTPWLATNHILVKSIDIKTSNELGFNDMPIWLTVSLTLSQSRNLGRNEIIRMFNNSFLREYSPPNEENKFIVEKNTLTEEKAGTGSGDEGKQTDESSNGDRNPDDERTSGFFNKNKSSNGDRNPDDERTSGFFN